MTEPLLISSENAPEVVFVHCASLGYPDTVIKTTNKEVKDLVASWMAASPAFRKDVLRKIRKNLNVNTDSLYAEGGKRWTNFCNDVVLYYTLLYVMKKVPIPIVMKESIAHLF